MDASSKYASKYVSQFDFLFFPAQVRANIDIPAGKLQLLPFTDMDKIMQKSSTSRHFASHKLGQLYLESPVKPKSDDMEAWSGDTLASPFFMVEPTGVASAANVKLSKLTLGLWTFPVFSNPKPIEAWDRLMFLDGELKAKNARLAAAKVA